MKKGGQVMTQLFGISGTREDGPRLLLASLELVWGLSRLPEIRRGPWGKPWFPERPDLHFNLSHSGGLLLCALSDRPVGVDIEQLRPRSRALLERSLTPEELEWCQQAEDPWPRFYTLWTRRESACKQTGRGLTFPVRAITVPLPPADTLNGLCWRNHSGPGWVAALCAVGELPSHIRWLDAGCLPSI